MAYITLADAKNYIDTEESVDNLLLTNLISGAVSWFENHTGRVFEAGSDATHYFTVGLHTEDRVLTLDGDLAAITSVKTNADNGSGGTTVSASEYVTSPRNATPYRKIRLLESSSKIWTYTSDPEMGVTVTGKWCYSITPPEVVKQAIRRLVAWMYRQKDSPVFDTIAQTGIGTVTLPRKVPNDVQDVVNLYMRKI